VNVELWPIGRVLPYARNPRKNTAIVERLAESIRSFGFCQPLIVDPAGVLVIGHARFQAAQALGLLEVPVCVAEGLSDGELKALRIADNRTREFSEWDFELLRGELEKLGAAAKLTGFDPADPLLQVGWTPPPLTPLPTRDGGHALDFTPEDWRIVGAAIEKAREIDSTMTPGRAIELIAADWLAGNN